MRYRNCRHIHLCREVEASASPSMRVSVSRDVAPRLLVKAAFVTEYTPADLAAARRRPLITTISQSKHSRRIVAINQSHLERVLSVVIEHYNGPRPHRALDLTRPQPQCGAAPEFAA